MHLTSACHRPWAPTTLRHASAALLLLIATASPPSMAQMGGGMGPGGGGRHNGGGREGGNAATPQEQPTLDDLMAPDPWRIWLDKLQLDSPRLALSPQQQPVFDAFMRELDLAAQSNAQRVNRAVRHRPSSVSALVDVSRDLRTQSDEAQDWVAALADLSLRWEALRAVLAPEQQALVDASYRAARDASAAGARGNRRDPPAAKATRN